MDKIAEIADALPAKIKHAIGKTPHPQPMPPKFLWAGTLREAVECAERGLLDKKGFTETGLAVRKHLNGE